MKILRRHFLDGGLQFSKATFYSLLNTIALDRFGF
jgi:hypothetical protein